jgi:acetyltransferase-like isoleucine patch superfamily enzyme
MVKIWAPLMCFFGMQMPSRNVRIAMYRKAGIRIGKVREFGRNVWLDITFKNLINIEDDVLIAGHLMILSHSFLMDGIEREGFGPVIIKKGARIGLHTFILPGVTIGENSVIGAGAVVTNNIPPNCLAVGVPAKPVRYFNSVAAMSNKFVVKDGKKFLDQPLLYVRCKTCKIEFWSALRIDKKVFKTLDLRSNCHPCPNCGSKDRYEKKDYYYKD